MMLYIVCYLYLSPRRVHIYIYISTLRVWVIREGWGLGYLGVGELKSQRAEELYSYC